MSGRKGRVVGAAVALALSGVLLAGCTTGTGTGSGGSTAGAGNYKIVVMPKSLGNKYFGASDAGAKKAIESFGGTYTEAGSNEAAPASQTPFIQTAIQNGAGAIILAANDPQAVCADLKSAQAAGIKIVTFDSDTTCRDAVSKKSRATSLSSAPSSARTGPLTVCTCTRARRSAR